MTGEKEDLRGERRRFEKSELYLDMYVDMVHTRTQFHLTYFSPLTTIMSTKNRDSWKNIQSQKSIEINPIL